ncbi:MAG: NAD(P)H:quinone oxidoreductase [Candidatus Palauibacterales bacterium]|nr:NAD(P)H:quinone oxidoreductase [Candidatus Palauibacterales bacterium]
MSIEKRAQETETVVKVVFYSMYGHVHEMAREVAEGARDVPGTRVELLQVPELVPEETLEESGAKEARAAFGDVPVAEPEDLVEADALLFGAPTRFGNMSAQMRNFLDQTGGLWFNDELVGTVGGFFTSANTQHGGQESTLLTAQVTLQHLGMIVLGVPYSEERQQTLDEISGGSPYGASTVAGLEDSPTENERGIARFQGRHAARTARRLRLGRMIDGESVDDAAVDPAA